MDNTTSLNLNSKLTHGAVIWACNSSASGYIQGRKRPYIVISNNLCNKNSHVITVIPLTKQLKKPLPTHCNVPFNGSISTALCEQITSINVEDIGAEEPEQLPPEVMQEVYRCVATQLASPTQPLNAFVVCYTSSLTNRAEYYYFSTYAKAESQFDEIVRTVTDKDLTDYSVCRCKNMYYQVKYDSLDFDQVTITKHTLDN